MKPEHRSLAAITVLILFLSACSSTISSPVLVGVYESPSGLLHGSMIELEIGGVYTYHGWELNGPQKCEGRGSWELVDGDTTRVRTTITRVQPENRSNYCQEQPKVEIWRRQTKEMIRTTEENREIVFRKMRRVLHN